MTPLPPPDERPAGALTPDESRYLDGEMSAQEMRSMELRLAADPERAARLAAWRDAMDLWRDDAGRAAARVAADPDALADRILAGLASQGPRRVVTASTARLYATAAMVLIAVGVIGTILAQPARAGRSAQPQVAEVDDLFLDVLAEGSEFNPRLMLSKEDR